MDSGTKMNTILIQSEWSKNTKAIFAIPEKRLFSPTAQDILRQRIISRACIFLNVSTYFGEYHIDKQKQSVLLRTLNMHMSGVLTY